MLQQNKINTATLELIKELQHKEYLQGFVLVGGTALALLLGHRSSIDIDLFCDFDFNESQLKENLVKDFAFNQQTIAKNTLLGFIRDIKVDFIKHQYEKIAPTIEQDGICTASIQDICAMKLNAISGSGRRVKDFIDIYYLLDEYALQDIIGFFNAKYQLDSEFHVLKSLTYFEDANLSDWPGQIKDDKLTWKKIKQKIEHAYNEYMKEISDNTKNKIKNNNKK